MDCHELHNGLSQELSYGLLYGLYDGLSYGPSGGPSYGPSDGLIDYLIAYMMTVNFSIFATKQSSQTIWTYGRFEWNTARFKSAGQIQAGAANGGRCGSWGFAEVGNCPPASFL